jgi:hypothetical protein
MNDTKTSYMVNDTCKNWKSKRLELISVTKTMFGF